MISRCKVNDKWGSQVNRTLKIITPGRNRMKGWTTQLKSTYHKITPAHNMKDTLHITDDMKRKGQHEIPSDVLSDACEIHANE